MGTGEKNETHGRKEINFLRRKVYRGRKKIFRESPAIWGEKEDDKRVQKAGKEALVWDGKRETP